MLTRPCILLSAVLLSACAGRYGHDGLRMFPPGSPDRAFFEKCTHNTYKDAATWFCETTASLALVERQPPRTHEQEVQAFIAREGDMLGAFKGKVEATLSGELSGMQFSTLGFEKPQEDPARPETKGMAPMTWVVFLATETMPDGSGVALSCSLAGSEASNPASVQLCHTGMKHLRDRMRAVHSK